jgi:NitT/TauT family transport system permease protein
MRRAVSYLVVVGVLLLAWWALTVTHSVAPLLLPPLADVGSALRDQVTDVATWSGAAGITALRTAYGFLIATALAVPIGIVLGRSRLLRNAYEPLLATIAAIPLVVLYPVLAATLGIGTSSKVVLGGLYAFFPIAVTTVRAVRQVDPGLVTAMHSMGARRAQVIRAVVVPSALPGIVGGLRVGLGLGLVTVIAAEFIAGDEGIGYELAAASQGYDSGRLFAWVVLAVALTIAVTTVFTALTSLLERTLRR